MRLNFSIKRLIIVVICLLLVPVAWLLAGRVFEEIEKSYIFKMPNKEYVIEVSKEYSLSPLLVYSVIKEESSFNQKAISKKNAKGLMQISDKTAEFIAEKLGVEQYDLFDGNQNVRFGCFYLRYLLNKFKDSDTAICAYNAGEGNVSNWLKNPLYSEDGRTLKSVPFSETQEYREKIKKTFAKYKKLYGNILDKTKKFE